MLPSWLVMISTYITSERMGRKPGRAFSFDIQEMLHYRSLGMGFSELGRKYGKDHTTIIYHCKRYGVTPAVAPPDLGTLEVVPSYEPPPPREKYKYQHLLEEEDLNPGKTYKQYLAEALKRPVEKRYHEIYYTHFTVEAPAAAARKRDKRSGRYAPDTGLDEDEFSYLMCDRDQGGEEWPRF